ncbi:hypothetical protein ACHAWF_016647 [Thalassiosira exigua]
MAGSSWDEHCQDHPNNRAEPPGDKLEEPEDCENGDYADYDDEDDGGGASIMEDDDDDTVVGTCLHCSAPPPPRCSSRGGGSGGGAFSSSGLPCSANSITATSAATSPSAATRVQVSCDDCRSFICDACHWCHEFQANHEIRVCDRCDAFYCRGCDEMDQCEDCSEVVCNTCSTLMSCKFCGCGLCEDCATACGRCGIVLCARDAKFAVECDTCRMSYCLVCLASGTKDPCVRCGHRPSKRVEQLVHLRLKSIYKAFKQSGASSSSSGGGSGGSNSSICSKADSSSTGGKTDSAPSSTTGGSKYSSALRSLAESTGAIGDPPSKDNFANFDQSMASEVAAVLQTASNSMASCSEGGEYVDGHPPRRNARGKRGTSAHDHSPSPGGGSRHRSSTRGSGAASERYFRRNQAELEAAAAAAEAEAEAAAAALLAELDEEKASSNVGASKKSKKKKKKKERRKEATAEREAVSEHQQKLENASMESSPRENVKKFSGKDDRCSSMQKKKASKKASKNSLRDNAPKPPIEEESSDEEMNFERLVAGAKGGSRPPKKSKKEDNSEEGKSVAPPPKPNKPEPSPPPIEAAPSAPATTADFDAELAILLSNEDEEGLEIFLVNLKGVPGLGAARKTAKKALKRIREARRSHDDITPPAAAEQPRDRLAQQGQSSGNATSHGESGTTKLAAKVGLTKAQMAKVATTKTAAQKQNSRMASANATNTVGSTLFNATSKSAHPTGTQHEPLLRVVSRSSIGNSGNSNGTSRGGGSSATPASSNPSSSSAPSASRAECVMHMSPAVVGWVIGKGGTRIRDMMEESGAKIWIDQESMGAREARVVYVSGRRSSVDVAVRMVKDLVSKAPVAASAAAALGVATAPAHATVPDRPPPAPKPAPASMSAPSVTRNPSTAGTSSTLREQPASFAEAIAGPAAAPVPSAAQPVPRTTSPTSQATAKPQQVWAVPGATSVVAPTPHAAPQSVEVATSSTLMSGSVAASTVPDAGAAPLFQESTIKSELTCDPRFVALLIGRRGWTVKNIQTESGAELDIDQSVDPPKIVISGSAESVGKAERMVREVLRYPQEQLRPNDECIIVGSSDSSAIGGGGGGSVERDALRNVPDMMPAADVSSTHLHPMALQTTGLRRDVSSSTAPSLLDELQIQQEPSHIQSNFMPGYAQYQHQQTQGGLSLFRESPTTSAGRIPEFLPENSLHRHQSVPPVNMVEPSSRVQEHDWGGHHGQHRDHPVQSQYPTLPPFPANQYLFSNPNIATHQHLRRHHSPPEDVPLQRPSSFAIPPLSEQHLHFPQNLESTAVHQQTPMPPPPVPPVTASAGINDYMSGGGSSGSDHNVIINGWDMPANKAMMGGSTWNQGHNPTQQPSFRTQPAPSPPPLSSNPFHHDPPQPSHYQHSSAHSPTQPMASSGGNNHVSKDSLMVDNMFASLGSSNGDGDGLLNALNSVSLSDRGDATHDWGSKIAGWGAMAGEDSTATATGSFLQHSRLGDYREER